MDQRKIGNFLKELRKEKGLTQEELAEMMNVTNRSVSRWETGSNMPDLDILIELSDYYEVDIKEILDGERKGEKMNKDMEETILKVADYTNTEAERNNKRVRLCNAIGMFLLLVYVLVKDTEIYNDMMIRECVDFAQGMGIGMLFVGLIYSSKYGMKVRAFKQRLLNRG